MLKKKTHVGLRHFRCINRWGLYPLEFRSIATGSGRSATHATTEIHLTFYEAPHLRRSITRPRNGLWEKADAGGDEQPQWLTYKTINNNIGKEKTHQIQNNLGFWSAPSVRNVLLKICCLYGRTRPSPNTIPLVSFGCGFCVRVFPMHVGTPPSTQRWSRHTSHDQTRAVRTAS